ncbi:MAG TPA: carboxypeptidase-like regulatory domain-containing protein [Planctomycetota bacterium]|nr:carboxypeptidase-like regulatory domain-containing protein [Planctomycetota bacterium]
MKGRHVVIVVFVFGLTLMAILFRLLPGARPPVPPTLPAPPHRETLPPPPPLPDRETAGTIEVFVRSNGAPIVGATVTFQGPRMIQMTSATEGRCIVPRADPGMWRIVARAANLAAATTVVTVETGRTARADLELAAGARLEGIVRDPAGNAVAGARVALALPDPTLAAQTDPDGRYAISGIPPGTHSVTASSERLRPQTRENLSFSVPGQTLVQDFTLPYGTNLAGSVVDETGGPVSRATVTITNEVARVVRTDSQGRFEASGLGEGPITVSVVARGFAPSWERSIAAGRNDLVLRLIRGATLRGRIDGAPATISVLLKVYEPAHDRWRLVDSKLVKPDAAGGFTIGDLPSGQYQVVIETGDLRTPVPLHVELRSGQPTEMGLVALAPK